MVISVKGEDYVLEFLTKRLNSPTLRVTKDNDDYYLKASDLENNLKNHDNSKDHSEARLIVSEIVGHINRILKVDWGYGSSVKVGKIICEKDGEPRYSDYMDIKSDIFVTKPVRLNIDYEALIQCMENNKEVEDAFIFYYLETNWHNLFKVWETIEFDTSREAIIKKGWANELEINLFTCTAHNREASGYHARHAVDDPNKSKFCKEKVLSSNKPMGLYEAQKLIKRILIKWVKSKCII